MANKMLWGAVGSSSFFDPWSETGLSAPGFCCAEIQEEPTSLILEMGLVPPHR